MALDAKARSAARLLAAQVWDEQCNYSFFVLSSFFLNTSRLNDSNIIFKARFFSFEYV